MPFQRVDTNAVVNGRAFQNAHLDFRIDDMNEGFKKLRLQSIPTTEEQAFKKNLQPEVPEIKLKNMSEEITSGAKVHQNLQIRANTVRARRVENKVDNGLRRQKLCELYSEW